MNQLFLATKVVLPLIIMMGVGYIVRLAEIMDDNAFKKANSLVFRVFLPLMLFESIYTIDRSVLKDASILQLDGIIMAVLLSSVVIGALVLNRTRIPASQKSVIIQGIYRGNTVIFGIPVAESIYGAGNASIAAAVVAVIVPFLNIMAVFLFECYRGGKVKIGPLLLKVLKNPLVIASLLAGACLLFKIEIPQILMSPISTMADAASPLAFVILGGSLELSALYRNRKLLAIPVIGRLVVVPGIILALVYLAGFRGIFFGSCVGACATPVAVSSFSMAMEMGGDGELAAQIVTITTLLSIVSLFFWVLCLGGLM